MAEDLHQGGICGENNKWWRIDSTTSVFPPPPPLTSSSPNCSVATSSNWQTDDDFMNLKASPSSSRSCGAVDGTNNNNFVCDDHSYHQLGFTDEHKPQKNNESDNASASILQMMGYGLSSSTCSPNWDHHSLFRCNERPENNFNSVIQQETSIDSSSQQIQKDWTVPKSFSSSASSGCSGSQVSTIDIFNKAMMMNQEFSTMSSIITSTIGLSSSADSLPIGSASYVCPSTLIQGLYEHDPQLQHSLFTNRSSMSYLSTDNYGALSSSNNNVELSPIWSKVSSSSSFLKPSSSSLSSMAKQLPPPPPPIGLHFSNNTPFWNASADALNDMRAGAFASSSPSSTNRPSIILTKCTQLKSEESDLESAKKNVSDEGALLFKRQRIETPSPIPTFKVRKEKLGDRVTALQQLVSPFGKTDTASVLHEAFEYIKFLQDQVRVLSTPYLKSGPPIQRHQECNDTKVESSSAEEEKQDLRRRGLCLVPISSTFPVATETTADLWTPSLCFGGGGGGSLLR